MVERKPLPDVYKTGRREREREEKKKEKVR